MNKFLILAVIMLGYTLSTHAQHEHHRMPAKQDSTAKLKKRPATKAKQPKKDTLNRHQMHADHGMNMDTGMHPMEVPMTHAFSLNLPMNRNGSGTGWLPDASPMYGYMIHSGKWMYMVHGSAFLRYNDQNFNNDDKRGDSRFDAPTWFMLM
jgi:hypothetical protein